MQTARTTPPTRPEGQTAVSAPPPALDRKVVLIQCRLTAEKRLLAGLDPLLDQLAAKLTELGQQAKDLEERERLLVGATRLRNNRSTYVDGFRAGLAERFDSAAKALQSGGPGWGELDREAAAMLRTNVLEHEVAIIKLGVRIKERAGAALTEFSRRLATLCRRTDLDDGENPVGPAAVAHAVYAGFDAAQLDGRAARAARTHIEEAFVPPAAALYGVLNQLLQALGVHPAVPKVAHEPAAPAAPSTPANTTPTASVQAGLAAATAAAAAAAAEVGPSIAAQSAAARAVAAAMRGRTIPPALDMFLRETWLRVLALAHDRGGADGAPWRESLATLDDLIWSVQPKTDAAAQSRLRTLLPALTTRLALGMDFVALDPARRKAVLDMITRHCRDLLRGDH
jgi:hypothetical protein